MDLVRFILIAAEAADGPITGADIAEYGCDERTAAFHVELMASHGLVDGKVQYTGGRVPYRISVAGLTWDGYDYLDAIRSDRVWERARRAIGDTVGDASLSVIKEACSALALSMVKASLGI